MFIIEEWKSIEEEESAIVVKRLILSILMEILLKVHLPVEYIGFYFEVLI
jgi:hypothetical protein